MVLNIQIRQTLEKYYQNKIHPAHRHFELTRQYLRLEAIRSFHKRNHWNWDEFKSLFKQFFPDYRLNDWTQHHKNAGFYLAVSLIRGLRNKHTGMYFIKFRKPMDYFKIFVSFTGPYFFHYKFSCKLNTEDNCRCLTRSSIYEENYDSLCKAMASFCEKFWMDRGYFKPDRLELAEPVTDFYFDYCFPEGLQLFSYLFDHEECIKLPGMEIDNISTEVTKQRFSPWHRHYIKIHEHE